MTMITLTFENKKLTDIIYTDQYTILKGFSSQLKKVGNRHSKVYCVSLREMIT